MSRCSRLSLEEFKPLFLQFLNRLKLGGSAASLLTMFKLTERVAAALRHLFTFAVAALLTEARQVCKPAYTWFFVISLSFLDDLATFLAISLSYRIIFPMS